MRTSQRDLSHMHVFCMRTEQTCACGEVFCVQQLADQGRPGSPLAAWQRLVGEGRVADRQPCSVKSCSSGSGSSRGSFGLIQTFSHVSHEKLSDAVRTGLVMASRRHAVDCLPNRFMGGAEKRSPRNCTRNHSTAWTCGNGFECSENKREERRTERQGPEQQRLQ